METATMGRVTADITVENLADVFLAHAGTLPAKDIRVAQLPKAIVDTGAAMLALPAKVIRELGLLPVGKKRFRTTVGVREANLYSTVQLKIQGRECRVDVAEVPDDCPALIGQIPLEALDFVVDPAGQRLIGNPEHGGEQMYDEF